MTKRYTVKLMAPPGKPRDAQLEHYQQYETGDYFSKTDKGWVECTVVQAMRKSNGEIYLKLRRHKDGKTVLVKPSGKPFRGTKMKQTNVVYAP